MTSRFMEEYGKDMFPKYDDKELLSEMRKFKHSGKSLLKNLNHFFKEIRYTGLYSLNPKTNPTPYARMQDDVEMDKIIDKIKNTESTSFYKDLPMHACVDKYFNFNCGVTSQFDPKYIKIITNYAKDYFEDYFSKFNVHDPSCGWGCRLTANFALNNNYYGTDPNTKLNTYLNNAKDFYTNKLNAKLKADIRCLGSEVFIPEWENKMDYSFTSPPYFDLEIYCDEDTQSVKDRGTGDTGYKNWVQYYVKPTVENIHKYVKDGGFASINIKNIKKYNLYDDWFNAFKDHGGFEFHEELEVDWDKVKNTVNENGATYKEKIMVFKVKK